MLNIFRSDVEAHKPKSVRRAVVFAVFAITLLAIPFVDATIWFLFYVVGLGRDDFTVFAIIGPTATVLTILVIIAPIIAIWNQLYRRLGEEAERASIAKKEAERLLNQRTEFVAYVSHEIRNPLNGIIGIAQSLDHTEDMEVVREKTGIIKNSANDLMFILNDILDIAKIDEGKVELHPAPTSLKKQIEELYNFWRTRAEDNGLRLDLKICETFPDHVNIDAQRFRQVANNLISNAIKYSDRGSVLLSADCDFENQKAVISVQDTGIGIPPDLQETIFQAYQQVEPSHRNAARKIGTGLGLPIARRLARMMGGDVRLVSSSQAGSKFEFSFLVELVENNDNDELSSAQIKDRFGGKLALVADDSIASAIVAREHLTKLGFQCEIVNSGQAAISALNGQKFDWAFLDDNLGDMRGKEVLREAQPDGPVIFVAYTGRSEMSHPQEYRPLGFDGFVLKPASLEAFKSELLRLSREANWTD